uniref:Uncharacterized protein n=1 Tax=Panagrolaimus superbus TaxID=310955 RepID=A0A914YPI9_9BILA
MGSRGINERFIRQCGRSFACTSKLACCTCASHECKIDADCDQIIGLTCVAGRCQPKSDNQLLLLHKSFADNTTVKAHFCDTDKDCFDEAHCRDNKCTHNLVRKRETCVPLKPMDCLCVCVEFPELFKPCQMMLPKCNVDEDCALNSFCFDDQSENGQRRCSPLIARPTNNRQ